jgi:hypothetical protein
MRILHPLFDNIDIHVSAQSNGSLKALNETGIFHIQRLRLNRRELVAHRRLQLSIENAMADYEAVNTRVDVLERRISSLQKDVSAFSQETDEIS